MVMVLGILLLGYACDGRWFVLEAGEEEKSIVSTTLGGVIRSVSEEAAEFSKGNAKAR